LKVKVGLASVSHFNISALARKNSLHTLKALSPTSIIKLRKKPDEQNDYLHQLQREYNN